MITPREVLMLAVGILVGLAFQKPSACKAACCVARELWINGKYLANPDRIFQETVRNDFECQKDHHFFKNTEIGDACKCKKMELVLEHGARVVRPAMTPPPFHLNLNVDL